MKYLFLFFFVFLFSGCYLSPKEMRSKIDECSKYELGYINHYNFFVKSGTVVTEISCCTKDNFGKTCHKEEL